MTLRVATETEVDTYLAILWFNDVVLSVEIDQAGSQLCLSLSLLAIFAYSFITFLSGRTIYVDAQPQKRFTCCIGRVLHRVSRRNLDPTVPCRWLPRESPEGYVESDACFLTDCSDLLPRLRKWLNKGNPVGNTGTPLRAVLYRNRM